MTNKNIKKYLQTILNDNTTTNTIEKAVVEEVLDCDYENIQDFFSDLFTHGCISGMIGSLIYYTDTHSFYDTHYHQIEEIRNEYEDSIGSPFTIKHDLKNDFAWFAFEEVTRHIANDLELEI